MFFFFEPKLSLFSILFFSLSLSSEEYAMGKRVSAVYVSLFCLLPFQRSKERENPKEYLKAFATKCLFDVMPFLGKNFPI